MRIWSMLLIKSDSKWCIHLSRSLFLNYPFTNIKWHYEALPFTMTPSIDQTLNQTMTLLPNLTFTKLREVSIEHLQRLSLIRILSRSICFTLWDQYFSHVCRDFSDCTSNIPRYEFTSQKIIVSRKRITFSWYRSHTLFLTMFDVNSVTFDIEISLSRQINFYIKNC